jgi:hypothetical protein
MQQIQQVMQQLQENEQFKSLPPLQQQQLAVTSLNLNEDAPEVTIKCLLNLYVYIYYKVLLLVYRGPGWLNELDSWIT